MNRMTENYIGYALPNYMAVAEKYTPTATERAVAMIMCTPQPKIFVRHMKCQKQTNGNDCGVYAIANMISILHGIDPRSVSFNLSVMRRHLQQELEIRTSLISPIENCFFVKKQTNKPVLKLTGIPVFCTWRMPEHGSVFTCTECKIMVPS